MIVETAHSKRTKHDIMTRPIVRTLSITERLTNIAAMSMTNTEGASLSLLSMPSAGTFCKYVLRRGPGAAPGAPPFLAFALPKICLVADLAFQDEWFG